MLYLHYKFKKREGMVTKMKSFTKKILVGIISGALIFTGGIGTYKAFAAENPEQMPQYSQHRMGHHNLKNNHRMPKMSDEQIAEISKKIAEHYGIDEKEVKEAFKNRTNPRDINHAAILAKLSGKSFSSVLAMKTDWKEIGEKLGVKPAQVREFMRKDRIAFMTKESSLDDKVVDELMKDGYNPHDIVIAGKIAKESNKNVKDVLTKKKINNRWRDVAEEFGVEFDSLFPNFKHFGERNQK